MGEDEMLIATQNWLVSTYGNNNQFTINVPTDGTGRGTTIKALIQALQIELEVSADVILIVKLFILSIYYKEDFIHLEEFLLGD